MSELLGSLPQSGWLSVGCTESSATAAWFASGTGLRWRDTIAVDGCQVLCCSGDHVDLDQTGKQQRDANGEVAIISGNITSGAV